MSAQLAQKTFKDTIHIASNKDVILSMLLNPHSNIIKKDRYDGTQSPSTLTVTDSAESLAKVISMPKFNTVPEIQNSPFLVLQEWEGIVTKVGDSDFIATLLDITLKRKIEDEEADFLIADLTEDGKKQLRVGAIFRWIIGYRSIAGTKERSSKIIFRRMPAWSKKDLDLAAQEADRLSNSIRWE